MAELNSLIVKGNSRFINGISADDAEFTRINGNTVGNDPKFTDTNNRRTFYATCDTAAATAAKVVTLVNNTGWELIAGTVVGIKFTNTNSASNVTLDVNGTGAKSIWYNTSAYTSTSGTVCGIAGAVNYYMYDGSTYWVWLNVGKEIDTTTNYYDRNKYTGTITAETAIAAKNIIVGKNGKFHQLNEGTAFDITYPILYANSAIAANATSTDNYDVFAIAITTTKSMTLTAYKPVYIKGTLSGVTLTPDSELLTQTVPSSADGRYYVLLGVAYSTTAIYLDVDHDIYCYQNGGFGKYVRNSYNAKYLNTYSDTDFAVSRELRNTDLNTVKTPGFYNAPGQHGNTNCNNQPSFGLEVIHDAAGQYYTQIMYSTSKQTFMRWCSDNTWSDWVQNSYSGSTFYGTCTTAAGTSAKEITVADPSFVLKTGITIGVKFNNTNSASNVTLNVNSTGAKSIWYQGAVYTGNGSPYACGNANNITYYIYDGTYWVYNSISTNTNTDTFDVLIMDRDIKCGSTAIVGDNIIVADANGLYKHLKLGTAFDITYPILYARSAIAANSTGTDNYLIRYVNLTTTQNGITLTPYKPVYIKGTLGACLFTPESTTPLTQTVPTAVDGYAYMFLGIAYSTTNIYLTQDHTVYQFRAGYFRPIAMNSVAQSQTTTTYWRKLLLSEQNNTEPNQNPGNYISQAYTTQSIEAQPSTGTLKATNMNGTTLGLISSGATVGAHMEYNSTNKTIEFVFN